ncbi:hypothetical protein QR680_003346 [Steinernema hermaphroditum]|uniref:VWFA domain-containing protein n=1 Tax=Steinernema hermaphroditum TaxID=289476 RepID=A0AA39LK20_9BILA|nr:hypothetical protein QR680_003346 [Steinernema hermaphroditum]
MAAHHYFVALTIAFAFVYVKTQTQKPIFPVSCFLNVLIVLDRSDSVKGAFNRSRDFVLNVSDELNIGPNAHRVAMIVYSGLSYRREIFKWNFARSNAEFKKITGGLRAIGGTTNTRKALEIGLELMDSRNKSIPTLIMVVTDGRSADDPKDPARKLQEIPSTWVFAAATGDPKFADRQELFEIAGDVNHVILQSGRELATDITKKLLRQAQEKCRTTTTSCELDLILVMDFSTTTTPIYKEYISMAERLISRLKIGPHYTRVSLVVFSTVGKTHSVFDLKRYDTADEIIKAIRNAPYSGGTTAVGQGIQVGREQINERKGGRPKIATRAMVVFTDGWSNKGPDPEQMSKAAKADGFQIYSVGVETTDPDAVQINQYTLDVIADAKHAYTQKNFEELINIIRQRNVKCM